MKKYFLTIILFLIPIIQINAKTINIPISGTDLALTQTKENGPFEGTYNNKPVSIYGEFGTYNITYDGQTQQVDNVSDANLPTVMQFALEGNSSAINNSNIVSNDTSTNNILNYGNKITDNDLREGNVDMNTIPLVLVSIINVLLGVAGTISIVALIYYAIQMQINSGITGDSSGVDNAKKGMKGAILGFIVAILAWFIVIRFIEILSGLS